MIRTLLVTAAVFVSSFVGSTAEAWHGSTCGSYMSTWGSYGMGGGFRSFSSSLGNVGFASRCFTPTYTLGYTASYGCFAPTYGCNWVRPISYCAYRPPIFWSGYRYGSCFDYGYVPSYVYRVHAWPSYRYGWSPWFSPSPFFLGNADHAGNRLNDRLDIGRALLASTTPAAKVNLSPLLNREPIGMKPAATMKNDNNEKLIATQNAADEAWLVVAAELIDSMAFEGGVKEGLAAVEQLAKVRDKLPTEILWRGAILAALAERPSNEVARFIQRAESNGDAFSPTQLPGASLRGYVRRIPDQSIDAALNRIALSALSGDQPHASYSSLAALLRLDGQYSRAKQFSIAAASSKPTTEPSAPVSTLLASSPIDNAEAK